MGMQSHFGDCPGASKFRKPKPKKKKGMHKILEDYADVFSALKDK
jgi:hypothetical protein